MLDRTFLISIALVITLWVVVTFYERKRDQRNIDRIRTRLRKKEARDSARRDSD